MKAMLILFSLALGTSGVAAAKAPATDESPTATVTYSDLDLSRPDGQAALNSRVRRAVNDLCREVTGSSPLYYAVASCRQLALKHARVEVERAIAHAQSPASVLASRADRRITIAAAQ